MSEIKEISEKLNEQLNDALDVENSSDEGRLIKTNRTIQAERINPLFFDLLISCLFQGFGIISQLWTILICKILFSFFSKYPIGFVIP